ncbi:MAG: helix-turn-helix domain-containing protein [Defluviitaleaceae bacterium]|nr:helix-turn-helix domain-containing protein [Defluviitaleaceae bacterium]
MKEVYDFGLRLKKLREERGLTQQVVADRLGVTVWSIINYEKNEQLPPIEKLETMALLYRVSLDYLRNLDKRKAVYIDDLPKTKQKMILDIIETIRNEHNNKTED